MVCWYLGFAKGNLRLSYWPSSKQPGLQAMSVNTNPYCTSKLHVPPHYGVFREAMGHCIGGREKHAWSQRTPIPFSATECSPSTWHEKTTCCAWETLWWLLSEELKVTVTSGVSRGVVSTSYGCTPSRKVCYGAVYRSCVKMLMKWTYAAFSTSLTGAWNTARQR